MENMKVSAVAFKREGEDREFVLATIRVAGLSFRVRVFDDGYSDADGYHRNEVDILSGEPVAQEPEVISKIREAWRSGKLRTVELKARQQAQAQTNQAEAPSFE